MTSFGNVKRKHSFFTKGTSTDDITKYSYISLNLDISAKESSGRSLFLSPDGTKVYVIGSSSNMVHQYNLSTAYKIDTGIFASTFDVTPQLTNNCYSLFFKSDGSIMYAGGSATDTICQYTLGTAWDISTAVYNQAFSVVAKSSSHRKIIFNSTGSEMYVLDNNKSVYQYTLGTPWDISTCAYSKTVVLNEITEPYGFAFNTDGTKAYANGLDSIVYQYNLGTAWDISTAVYSGKSSNLSTVDAAVKGYHFTSDMVYMYVIGSGNDKVYELKNS